MPDRPDHLSDLGFHAYTEVVLGDSPDTLQHSAAANFARNVCLVRGSPN